MARDMSALTAPINTPAGYGGANAPVMGQGETDAAAPRVVKAVNSQTAATGRGTASPEAQTVLKTAAAMVAVGLVLLWVFGGIVFKNANL